MCVEKGCAMIKGIAAAPGIVIGKAFVYREVFFGFDERHIAEEKCDEECEKLMDAVSVSKKQLSAMIEKSQAEKKTEQADILFAHLAMVGDESFIKEMLLLIKAQHLTAPAAVRRTVEKFQGLFESVDDAYLRMRMSDVHDIGKRLTNNLLQASTQGSGMSAIGAAAKNSIIVAHDLSPSDLIQLECASITGLCTEIGGRTSHSAILARAHAIPAIVGASGLLEAVHTGDTIILDADKGEIHTQPNDHLLSMYARAQQDAKAKMAWLKSMKNAPAKTQCGKKEIVLAANISDCKDCDAALNHGAKGIGLFRTEFLYLGRPSLPDETEQFNIYKKVAEKMYPEFVTIRTLDIGGDKQAECLPLPEEENPFLGWRAIRICLSMPTLFKTQLRAILRASAFGHIRVIFPMISGIAELRAAKSMLADAQKDLDKEGVAYDHGIGVGVMIEVPSAAIIADLLIREADFFSIGTNDLIQYTLAADRLNEKIAYLYEPQHPAILRMVKFVADAAHRAGKWVGVCGEMAGDEDMAAILVGLGVDELSMSAASIPSVKGAICHMTFDDASETAKEHLQIEHAGDIGFSANKAF